MNLNVFVQLNFSIGDYGRGGVEAIRRLLNKDACIGADLTMVYDFLVFCGNMTIFCFLLANWRKCHSCYSINSTNGHSCSSGASSDLFLSRSFDSSYSTSCK